MSTYKFTRHLPPISIYSRFRVKNSMRALKSPRVAKAWRTRKLMNLTAFFRNRFYEIDRWYKARIEKPEVYPTCYTIEPDDHHKSLLERMEDLHLEKNGGRQLIDIGLAFDEEPHKDEENFVKLSQDKAAELEKLARIRKLYINPSEVESDSKTEKIRVQLAKSMADHCGIFTDLFHRDAFFYPVTNLHVGFDSSGGTPEVVNPVFYGNVLTPTQTSKQPEISYEADDGSFYTLMLTNPDGCLYDDNKEVLHWLVCNIPGNQVENGQTLCPYLQPLPLRGTGWHRLVFVLFKQDKYLQSLDNYKVANPADFQARTFDTPEFYLKNEDFVTPVGLAFFQSAWDKSCTECFHNNLKMEQPIYDFEWPTPFVPPQEEFPSEYQPFNDYLDQYRDYKDIDKEIFTKRLKRISPFKPDPPRPNFPNILNEVDNSTTPSWLYVENVKENEGYGKYRGIYTNPLD